jgi:predicted metalloprotease with PDZ domain
MRTVFTRAFVISISLLAFTASAITPVAQTYLEKAIQIMHNELLGSEKIDWAKVTTKALETAKNATATDETYEAIREALKSVDNTGWLGDPFPSTGSGLFIGIKTVNYRDQRVVTRVSAGSAGERAGIRPGDTLLTLNDKL